jgi:hypothetical protein
VAVRSQQDPQFFTGSLWMMTSGSWQVRVQVEGERGRGELAAPVPAIARRTERMDWFTGAALASLGAFLAVGLVSIFGAAVREAQLEPGAEPDAERRKRAGWAMLSAAAGVTVVLVLGSFWWTLEARAYDRYVYKPLEMQPELVEGKRLRLKLRDPGWLRMRGIDNFLPDHGHLMHLFVVRLPELERIWHLHPDMNEPGVFSLELPAMPAGRYQLYGDVVHQNGLPETLAAEVDLPAIAPGKPLSGDDAAGVGAPVSQAQGDAVVASLSGGHKMIWVREPRPIEARKPELFRFRVEDAMGQPARDLELYMGMQGHAVFLKRDRSVFAHVHPSGSVPMAALALTAAPPAMDHSSHSGPSGLPAEVSFPYGIPSAGDYRVFVQIKRAGRVETAIFDTRVTAPTK